MSLFLPYLLSFLTACGDDDLGIQVNKGYQKKNTSNGSDEEETDSAVVDAPPEVEWYTDTGYCGTVPMVTWDNWAFTGF